MGAGCSPQSTIGEGELELWETLTRSCGVCIAITNSDGQFVFANDGACSFLDPSSANELMGLTWEDVLPHDLAKVRRRCALRARTMTRPIVLIGMMDGICTCSIFRSIGRSMALEGDTLTVWYSLNAADESTGVSAIDGCEVILAEYNSLGSLSDLTERELAILALIGEGMTTQQTAQYIHRSVKTVEWHRRMLGKKLGAANRVELAKIAMRSGLCHIGSLHPRLGGAYSSACSEDEERRRPLIPIYIQRASVLDPPYVDLPERRKNAG